MSISHDFSAIASFVRSRSLWTGAVLLALAIAGSGASQACPSCLSIGDPFRVPHPHSIRIAVATRNAIEAGVLKSQKDRLHVPLILDLTRLAAHQIESFQRETGSEPGNRPIRITLLIVDRSLAFCIERRGQFVRVFPFILELPLQSDAMIVTSRAVVAALADLEMTIAEAESLKLLEIEGERSFLPCQRVRAAE
jgi:hypothetical protein